MRQNGEDRFARVMLDLTSRRLIALLRDMGLPTGKFRAWTFGLTFLASVLSLRADDWPQWLGPRRDGIWRETGILEKFPEGGVKVRWRQKIGGGYSGPSVANGRVYVLDRQLATGAENPKNAFSRGEIPGVERLVCLSEVDGKPLWTNQYDCSYTVSYSAGPRATPIVVDGKVFTLGAEGNLLCLDAQNGKESWARDLKKDFEMKTPMWGFAGHPLVDGRKVICLVGGKGSVAVAFDKESGRELWRALSAKEPGYAPPMIFEFGGQRQLIIWHPEAVNALDPETGKVLWSHALSPAVRAGMSIATPRKAGEFLFLSSFYNGSLLLKIGGAEPKVVWGSKKVSEMDTDGLHSVMSTPWIEDGYIYSPCSYGQFRCLKFETGERIWETFEPTSGKSQRWGNAFVVKQEAQGHSFIFSEQGDLIIANLKPERYEEISRTHLIDADNRDPGRMVVWSHPAYANRSVYARNDHEIVCASLAKEK